MKPRTAKTLREFSREELVKTLHEAEETLAQQKFQHSLKQLQNVAYLKTLKKDIARMHTVLNEK